MRVAHLPVAIIGVIAMHVAFAVWAVAYPTRGVATAWYVYGPLIGLPAYLTLATHRTFRRADDRPATAMLTLAAVIAGVTLVLLVVVLWETVPILLGEPAPAISLAELVGFGIWAFMLWPSGLIALVIAAAVPPAPDPDTE